MRDYSYNSVGKVESIGLANELNYEWHTPNSVLFNIVAVYTHKTNSIGGHERGAHFASGFIATTQKPNGRASAQQIKNGKFFKRESQTEKKI